MGRQQGNTLWRVNEWSQEFTSLGILYDADDLKTITKLNIEIKINEIQKLLYIWSTQNLMPYGKIIIIKSNIMPKITHILLPLPTPDQNTFEKLEEMFKKLIWNQNPPKLRKEITENLAELWGLKMTNIKGFDMSLKLSWLKGIMEESEG